MSARHKTHIFILALALIIVFLVGPARGLCEEPADGL